MRILPYLLPRGDGRVEGEFDVRNHSLWAGERVSVTRNIQFQGANRATP